MMVFKKQIADPRRRLGQMNRFTIIPLGGLSDPIAE